MYKVFGYGLEDIPYINRLKRRVFYAITLTILSLNIYKFFIKFKKFSRGYSF